MLLNDDISKLWLFYQDDSLKLYQIHRLDVAFRHVLGPTVDIETTTVYEGKLFVHWAAKVSSEQVARVMEIDGVCALPSPIAVFVLVTGIAANTDPGRRL